VGNEQRHIYSQKYVVIRVTIRICHIDLWSAAKLVHWYLAAERGSLGIVSRKENLEIHRTLWSNSRFYSRFQICDHKTKLGKDERERSLHVHGRCIATNVGKLAAFFPPDVVTKEDVS
jgi:hypothetical protein